MGKVLEALHRLQELERQLAVIRRAEAAKIRRVQACKRQVAKADEKLAVQELTRREKQIRLDKVNLEVAARDEAIQKHRDALSKARTNKEYAAILTAINTSKADNSKLETASLELMDEVQGMDDAAKAAEEERKGLVARVTAAEEELAACRAESEAELKRLQEERARCAEGIAPTTLSLFNRIAEHHDGEALVPVIKLSPKREEYSCGGCNMMITLEVVNLLQSRDDIQCCSVCGRILYLEPVGARQR